MGCQGGTRRDVSRLIEVVCVDFMQMFVFTFDSKDVRLPVQMQRAMAAEAEASREARAKVIAAEGEQKASYALKNAADIISQSPAALQVFQTKAAGLIELI